MVFTSKIFRWWKHVKTDADFRRLFFFGGGRGRVHFSGCPFRVFVGCVNSLFFNYLRELILWNMLSEQFAKVSIEKPCMICTWPGNFWDTVLDGCRNILLLWHIDPPWKGENSFMLRQCLFSFVISTGGIWYIRGWYTTADGRDNHPPRMQ